LFVCLENSINIPHLSENCWFLALNAQFQYESEDSLQTELRRTYISVRNVTCLLLASVRTFWYKLTLILQKNSYKTAVDVFLKILLQQDFVNKSSALVLGSGTGYSSFILTKYFSKVNLQLKLIN